MKRILTGMFVLAAGAVQAADDVTLQLNRHFPSGLPLDFKIA